MATLTVWKFNDPDAAGRTEGKLVELQRQELIHINDAAVVTWPEGRRKPRTHQLHDLVGAGALGGAFWGFLFGLLFLVPLLGMAAGAAAGAAGGSLADVGIDDQFIKRLRDRVTPGSSALFLLTTGEVVDRIAGEFSHAGEAELIYANLSEEETVRLREAFGDDTDEAAATVTETRSWR
jgi:uncharacterized membrane protein